MCSAISILMYTKLDPKYLRLQESFERVENKSSNGFNEINERSKGMLIGSILGGAVGGAIAGPVGVLAGILLGAKPGKDVEDKIKQQIEELKYKYTLSSVDWNSVAVNIGIVLGTVGGIMTLGGAAGFLAGGVIGGTVLGHLQQTIADNGIKNSASKGASIVMKGISSIFSKMKGFVNKFNSMLLSKRKKLEKDLQKQYKIREQLLGI